MGKFSDALEKSGTFQNKKGVKKEIDSSRKAAVKAPKPDRKSNSNNETEIFDLTLNDSFASEQFRMLKTKILFPDSGIPPKVILVTSAAPDEGKSYVSANLAHTIAQNVNEYVLLMDGDLRLPTIHKYFSCCSGQGGLSAYLKNEIKLEDVLVKTSNEKLTLLPGGNPPENPTELLSSVKMKDLIEEVKARYNDRYIIIDSPPPLLVAETKAIAKQVDGIIIVARHEATSKKELAQLIELFDKNKIIGVILNRYYNRLPKKYGYNKYY